MIWLQRWRWRSRFASVRLLVTDVDGVLTDGGLYYTEEGQELKRFNVHDGMGLRQLLDNGIEVAILSASPSPTVQRRAEKLGIRHAYFHVQDKLSKLQQLCQELEIDLQQVAYVGDDLNDCKVLSQVGLGCSVRNAHRSARQVARYVTFRSGGRGAVREICDQILRSQGRLSLRHTPVA